MNRLFGTANSAETPGLAELAQIPNTKYVWTGDMKLDICRAPF